MQIVEEFMYVLFPPPKARV